MSVTAKKPRKANFSELEVEVLVDSVSTNYSTLYGKFSSTLTNARKTAAWQEVADKVNAVSLQSSRDVADIKKKWQDIQSAAKKKEAERRRKMNQTGGGPMDHPSTSVWEEKVLQVIPSTAISGISGGKDTSEPRETGDTSSGTADCIPGGLIITEVPVDELHSTEMAGSSNCESSVVEQTTPVAPTCMSMSRGKRGTSAEALLDFEEEKLKIKRRRLEIEEEKLQVLKNIFNLMQENAVNVHVNPLLTLLSKED